MRSVSKIDPKAEPPTINDVARAAGVSITTVSRILNGKPDVAEDTRLRVLDVIDQLGYIPNSQAQRLAAGKSRMITLLFPFEHASFTQLELDFFVGAAAAASKRSYFFNMMTEPVSRDALINLFRSGQVDGVILMQIEMDDWRPPLLKEHNCPFVMIGRRENNDGFSYIDVDFENAILMACEHLVHLGHRQIGFLARPAAMRKANLGPAVRLMRGYRNACEEFGLTPLIREVQLTVHDVYDATHELLDENPDLTAIVTVHGASSTGIMRALRERGRDVPTDCSVVALATNKIAQMISPALTALNFPTDTMGYQAAKMLIQHLQHPTNRVEQIILKPELIIRESTTIAP